MGNMDQEKKFPITLVVIIVLIIAGLGWAWWANRGDLDDSTDTATSTGDLIDSGQLITAKHQFIDGRHIVAGEIDLPTPCHLLNTQVQVAKSLPEQVTINFSATSTGEDASIKATWNGQKATLNLVPVAPGESIEDFEVFIKG